MQNRHETITKKIDELLMAAEDSEMVRRCIQMFKTYVKGSFQKNVVPDRQKKPHLYKDRCDTLSELVEHISWARLHGSDDRLSAFLARKAIAYQSSDSSVVLGTWPYSDLYSEMGKIRTEVAPRSSADATSDSGRIGQLLSRNAILEAQVRVLSEERDVLLRENVALKSQVGELTAKVESLEASDTTKTREISGLTQRVSESEATVRDLTLGLEDSRRDNQAQLDAQAKQIQQLMSHIGLKDHAEGKLPVIETSSPLANANQGLYTAS